MGVVFEILVLFRLFYLCYYHVILCLFIWILRLLTFVYIGYFSFGGLRSFVCFVWDFDVSCLLDLLGWLACVDCCLLVNCVCYLAG